jgi:hypothetical protein
MELEFMATARQRLRQHNPAAMKTHVTREELLDTVFSMQHMSCQILSM